jgi:peptidyl-prolyl cis-trans isomerase B (cyclophilin B)
MDVVNTIAKSTTLSKHGHDDVPSDIIIIEKVTIK